MNGQKFLESFDPQIAEVGHNNYVYSVEQVIKRLDAYRKELEKPVYNNNCRCTVDETTGWTSVKCCNICGKPIKGQCWDIGRSSILDTQELKTADITVNVLKEVAVSKLKVNAHVRYWEDAYINGIPDQDGQMPFADGERWIPLIDLHTGKIIDWPNDVEADIHYKVCDDGIYTLLDNEGKEVKKIEGYVPDILCPNENGYGDYIILKIDKEGSILNFRASLEEFEYVQFYAT